MRQAACQIENKPNMRLHLARETCLRNPVQDKRKGLAKKQTETGSGDLPEPVGRMVCLKGNFLHHISHLQD